MFAHRQLFKHKRLPGGAGGAPTFPPANVFITNTNPTGSVPSAWSLGGQSFLQNVTGPNGELAYTSTDSGLSQHLATPPVSATGHYAGIAAKKGTNTILGMQSSTTTAIFDLNAGTILDAGTYTAVSMTPMGSGWYWCQVYAAGSAQTAIYKNADTQAHAARGTSFGSAGTMLSFGYALW